MSSRITLPDGLTAEMISQLKRLASLGQYVSPLHVALVYSGIGDTEQALAWLKKARIARRIHRVLENLSGVSEPPSEPRFQQIPRKVGLEV